MEDTCVVRVEWDSNSNSNNNHNHNTLVACAAKHCDHVAMLDGSLA